MKNPQKKPSTFLLLLHLMYWMNELVQFGQNCRNQGKKFIWAVTISLVALCNCFLIVEDYTKYTQEFSGAQFSHLWKFSQVAILKLEHCSFCIWKLIYTLINLNKSFFSKMNLILEKLPIRNCRDTNKLLNASNHNVLPSKLRPVKTFW